ncbi:hypothetical protein LJC18_03540 [Lachnospiraceae bacterium OttesenSCG-928-E19]|nr:hypothetical protein [Lachnospiraceae bacterium OttesenSCG-928-E19]
MLQTHINITDYDILEIANTRNKDAFVEIARQYFHDDFFVPDGSNLFEFDFGEQNALCSDTDWKYHGGDMHGVSWNYLFFEYMRSVAKNKQTKYPTIQEIVKNINTETVWCEHMLKLRDKLFNLFVENNDILAQKRNAAIEYKKRGFNYLFKVAEPLYEKRYKVVYSEDLLIPNHSKVVVQVPIFAAAKLTSDLLYYDGGNKTMSIKMVNANTDPLVYVADICASEFRNSLISLRVGRQGY